MEKTIAENPGVVVNPCKACAPLGAALALKGIRNSMCILHGSQGCATYIRRFFIGHFREPVDIASSSFDESTAVFGGKENLMKGIGNIISGYSPELIGIATSCLAETIGEDIGMYIKEIEASWGEELTFIHTDTAAYKGTHIEGFIKMTAAAAELAEPAEKDCPAEKDNDLRLNLIPWMVSPADLRYLKQLMIKMKINATLLPDYSLSLDGGAWTEYESIPPGGTPVDEIRAMGKSDFTLQFGEISTAVNNPALVIQEKTGVPSAVLPLPVGLKQTDRFIDELIGISRLTNKSILLPDEIREERGRLLDAYADAHKYLSGLKAAVYGETDFAAAMAVFLCEIGVEPAVILTGEKLSAAAEERIYRSVEYTGFETIRIVSDADFAALDKIFEETPPDLMIGNSKGYKTAREFGIPLIRAGFPIQDRFGGQRLLHLGYSGALRLTDEIVNTVIAVQQEKSPVGYMSM